MAKYIWKDPFKRPLNVLTCCPVGICTCVLVKITIDKIFAQLGVPAEVTPTTESNPMGVVNTCPDVLITEGLQLDSILEKVPAPVAFKIHDMGKPEEIKQIIIDHFVKAGWMEVVQG